MLEAAVPFEPCMTPAAVVTRNRSKRQTVQPEWSARLPIGSGEDSRIAGDGMKLLKELLLPKGEEDILVPSIIKLEEESSTVERCDFICVLFALTGYIWRKAEETDLVSQDDTRVCTSPEGQGRDEEG